MPHRTVNSNVKIRQLFSLAWKRPHEAYSRIAAFLDAAIQPSTPYKSAYESITWADAVGKLDGMLFGRLGQILAEPELREIELRVKSEIAAISSIGPFGPLHNADFTLARACYSICRLIKPTCVIETGVCYGVTSAFILAALGKTNKGVLHSIDLPPLAQDADAFVGRLIPKHLQGRWLLYRGTSKAVLPALLKKVGIVDIFVHDSLHTYRNMERELSYVAPFLSPVSAVVADDIEGNSAFKDFIVERSPQISSVVRESSKPGLFGIAIQGCPQY